MVETGAGRDCRLVIEQIAQNLLHLPDIRTNAEHAAELFLKIARRRKMVGVDVRLQNRSTRSPSA